MRKFQLLALVSFLFAACGDEDGSPTTGAVSSGGATQGGPAGKAGTSGKGSGAGEAGATGDAGTGGSAGTGDKGGSAGSTGGKGGSAGTGGKGGSAGTGDKGGNAGTGDKGGSAGAGGNASTGDKGGAAGNGGEGGDAGQGGSDAGAGGDAGGQAAGAAGGSGTAGAGGGGADCVSICQKYFTCGYAKQGSTGADCATICAGNEAPSELTIACAAKASCELLRGACRLFGGEGLADCLASCKSLDDDSCLQGAARSSCEAQCSWATQPGVASFHTCVAQTLDCGAGLTCRDKLTADAAGMPPEVVSECKKTCKQLDNINCVEGIEQADCQGACTKASIEAIDTFRGCFNEHPNLCKDARPCFDAFVP